MSVPLTINSAPTLQSALGYLRQEFERHKYLRVSVKSGKARSIPQNSHSHAWYAQLSRELPDNDAKAWKAYCKLHFGVPILRADEPDFCAMYDEKIRPWSYEQKLVLMNWMPVTSLMTKAQLNRYEEAMQDHFAAQNVRLEYIEKDTP